MNEKTLNTLNYYNVKEIIKNHCVSGLGKELIDKINPSYDLGLVQHWLNETSEAKNLLDNGYSVPLKGISDITALVVKVEKDGTLEVEDLIKITDFLRGCKTVKRFFENKEGYAKTLCSYSLNITEMSEVEEEINRAIKGTSIDSNATKELKHIRRHIDVCEGKIKEKLEKFLKSSENKECLQDAIIVQRNGKFAIPIKAMYKNKIQGTIVDASSTGSTIFIEPNSVSKHTAELEVLRIEEQVEIYKILSTLTALVHSRLYDLNMNVDVIAKYDMIFAKAKYSVNHGCIMPKLNKNGVVNIVNGVHPLVENFKPLNFNIGKDYRALIITGPNAGGKTVVLKTVGLLTLMTLSGFHIKAEIGTEISIFQNLFVDIGDNQSIENSLSTFSSHMQNLSSVIAKSNKYTLVLLDEIGSGTEPNEGAGLGIAILEELYKKGVILLATTHYGEIKQFSEQHPDFENACMEYKQDTLEPLYKLHIGKSGNSNAFYIASKMGIPEHVRNKAKEYIKTKNYDLTVLDESKKLKVPEQIEDSDEKFENFEIGDSVKLIDLGKRGIVYEKRDNSNNVKVFVEDEVVKVFAKRLQIETKATELYPEGYDLSTLFTSYKERKLQHDIERGSKKALKKLSKENMKNYSK